MNIIKDLIKLKGRDFNNYINSSDFKFNSSNLKIDKTDLNQFCNFIIEAANLKKIKKILNEISIINFTEEQKKVILLASVFSGRKNLYDYFINNNFIGDGDYSKVLENLYSYNFINNYRCFFKDNLFLFLEDEKLKDKEKIIIELSSINKVKKNYEFVYLYDKYPFLYEEEYFKKLLLDLISSRKLKEDQLIIKFLEKKNIKEEDLIKKIKEVSSMDYILDSFIFYIKRTTSFFNNTENFEKVIIKNLELKNINIVFVNNIEKLFDEFLLNNELDQNINFIKKVILTLSKKWKEEIVYRNSVYSYKNLNISLLEFLKKNKLIDDKIKISFKEKPTEKNYRISQIENILINLIPLIDKNLIYSRIDNNNYKHKKNRL